MVASVGCERLNGTALDRLTHRSHIIETNGGGGHSPDEGLKKAATTPQTMGYQHDQALSFSTAVNTLEGRLA